MNTGASDSKLQNDCSRKNPPCEVEGTANAAGANALGLNVEVKVEEVPKENGTVVAGVEDVTKVEAEEGASPLLPNIEVPVENVEGMEKGVLGEKVVEAGA